MSPRPVPPINKPVAIISGLSGNFKNFDGPTKIAPTAKIPLPNAK